MKIAALMIPPSGRSPEKASRWDRGRTEAYGGGRIVLGLASGILEYQGIYRPQIRSNAWAPQVLMARLLHGARCVSLSLPRVSSGLSPKFLGSLLVQKNYRKFSSCLDFVRYGFYFDHVAGQDHTTVAIVLHAVSRQRFQSSRTPRLSLSIIFTSNRAWTC